MTNTNTARCFALVSVGLDRWKVVSNSGTETHAMKRLSAERVLRELRRNPGPAQVVGGEEILRLAARTRLTLVKP